MVATSALSRNCARASKVALIDVVRVGRAQALGQHVLHPGRGHHRAHRAAGNHARAFRSRLQQHLPGAETAQHQMRNRGLGQVDPDQVLLGRLDPLANGLGNFLGLARTVAHHARSGVAHHHQRGKRHVLAALDHLGHAIDGHHLILQVVLVGIEFLLQYRHCSLVCPSGLAQRNALGKLSQFTQPKRYAAVLRTPGRPRGPRRPAP